MRFFLIPGLTIELQLSFVDLMLILILTSVITMKILSRFEIRSIHSLNTEFSLWFMCGVALISLFCSLVILPRRNLFTFSGARALGSLEEAQNTEE